MSAVVQNVEEPTPEPCVTTLLDLVAAVAESAQTDREIVATITHLINSGQIKLVGNFLGADVKVG